MIGILTNDDHSNILESHNVEDGEDFLAWREDFRTLKSFFVKVEEKN